MKVRRKDKTKIAILALIIIIIVTAVYFYITKINLKDNISTTKNSYVGKINYAKAGGTTYKNSSSTIQVKINGTDTNYASNSLTENNITVKVGGTTVSPTTKTLSTPVAITNGVQYTLTLSGVSGNGKLTLEIAANTLTDNASNKNVLNTIDTGIVMDNIAPPIELDTSFRAKTEGSTGSYQEYNILETGTYKISAYGASGANGPVSQTYGQSLGGKGAYLYGNFNLTMGDKLILLIGQQGQITGTATSTTDTTAGGGGGGTFVTKVDSNGSYTITAKSSEKVTPLIVAAGGNGGNDILYRKTIMNGAPGTITLGTTSSYAGFTKFLTSPAGTTYTRGGLTSIGGYGGATGADDSNGLGGGWTLGTATSSSQTGATSYNAGTSTGGTAGTNEGNGKVDINLIRNTTNVSTTTVTRKNSAQMFTFYDIDFSLADNDGGSGINLSECKYIIDQSAELLGVSSTSWTKGDSITAINATVNEYVQGNSYLHVLIADNAGNKQEMLPKEMKNVVNSAPTTITVTSAGVANAYPDVLTIKATSYDGLTSITMPDGTVIPVSGLSYVTTYNATKNGPITVKATSEAGETETKTFQVENVIEFITEWTLPSASTTVTLPVYQTAPNIYVNWGDGTKENITTTAPQHTYTSAGAYDIKISGKLPEWNFISATNASTNRVYVTKIKQWGVLESTSMNGEFFYCTKLTGTIPTPHSKTFNQVTDFGGTFQGCRSLTGSIPTDLFANCSKVTKFSTTFSDCSGLTGSIPTGLFANCPQVTTFFSTFSDCSGLTGNIPTGLFADCPQVTNFWWTFKNCSSLTGSIPTGLFANCPQVTTFSETFSSCSGLTGSIPTGLFANCPQVTTFFSIFYMCRGLTGNIPTGLFDNCPQVTDFSYTFGYCSGLTGSIPTGLFDNCPQVTNFAAIFGYCSGLTGSIPTGLFDNCSKVTNFSYTFSSCSGLTGGIPAGLFNNCPQVTKFSYTFSSCSGLTGNAPTLWTRTNVTSSSCCFRACTKLTNYSSIPSGWK